MLARVILYIIVVAVLVRAVRRFLAGLAIGLQGPRPATRPKIDEGVKMARDPVCGTFVIPANALAVRDLQGLHHFCSPKCRDAFVARARRA